MDKRDKQMPEWVDRTVMAEEAMAYALALPPGFERNDALKHASRLRCAVDWGRRPPTRRGRPRKSEKCAP